MEVNADVVDEPRETPADCERRLSIAVQLRRRAELARLKIALTSQEAGMSQFESLLGRMFAGGDLWVVDERLAYHTHLASDMPMSRLRAVDVVDRDQPDLVVFNTPRAFADTKSPYQSVVIVEFKRPERNEYPPKEENPVEQVLRYVRKIKEGQAKDRDRRTINVGAIPFYAYILCSLTPRMRAIAEDHDFVRTPDNEGYFKYHQSQGCYIEIVSYDKVLNDAKKRNRAFFERLQIPAA